MCCFIEILIILNCFSIKGGGGPSPSFPMATVLLKELKFPISKMGERGVIQPPPLDLYNEENPICIRFSWLSVKLTVNDSLVIFQYF